MEPRQALQVDRPDRDRLGRVHLDPLPAAVATGGRAWERRASTGSVVNYAPLTVGGALVLFGGWYVLSANKWFKGPVREGTEEELERIEASSRAARLQPDPAA